jgi:hypothetical protein
MMALSHLPYDNGMPNAVAGNLQCPSPVVHAWMREANREALVQKNRTLLAKKLGSQGTDRLDRVPRGKEVRARVIESLGLCRAGRESSVKSR